MVQRQHNSLDEDHSALHGQEPLSSSQDAGEDRSRIAALEAEREQLKNHLKSAESRIQELELTQTAVINRINSLIGTLGSALEKSV